MKDKNLKLSERVMEEIKDKKVTLRSKYVYLAERFSRFGGFLVFSLLAVLFFILLFWYFKSTDNLLYLRFGGPGIFPFLQTFPYLFVLILITLIVAAGLLIKRIYYKKPFGVVLGILIVTIFMAGGAMVAFGVHQKMEQFAFDRREDIMFRPFLHHGRQQNERGIAGRVVSKNENSFVLASMCGEQTVKWLDEENKTGNNDFEIEDFVVGVGEWRDDEFFAAEIKVVEKDRLKMVVGEERNFLPPPPDRKPGSDNWRPDFCATLDRK